MREILEANLQDLGTGFLRMQGILVEQITLVRDAVRSVDLAAGTVDVDLAFLDVEA